MRYTVRPISDRTPFTGRHEPTPFRAKWGSTLEILGRELEELKATDVVIEVDVTESAIRLDGMLYANAKSASPAVRIAFDCRHGSLTYATDRYVARYSDDAADWQQNVRAIALSLESLRRVDRYGVTKRGEQYAGWKAIEATPASSMTRDAAARILERAAVGEEGESRERAVANILAGPAYAREVWKHARTVVHPDRNEGRRAAWDLVERAARVLGLDAAR